MAVSPFAPISNMAMVVVTLRPDKTMLASLEDPSVR
jgi:hypothetical protein